jgi:RNA 2',3'-cyclic 3'-phosphodiesterase
MRTFIAIELPLDIRNSLVKIQDKLKITLPKINWVKPANLHLSLKFLGEISLEQVESIQQIIADITKTFVPFEIRLDTLGVFPNYRTARIIWIGTNQPLFELKQLVDQLETKLLETGLPKEERPFQAHITLGRIKNPLIPADLEKELNKVSGDCLDLKFNTGGITLFQSLLDPGGPTYSKFI